VNRCKSAKSALKGWAALCFLMGPMGVPLFVLYGPWVAGAEFIWPREER
jgi:hypothetical protein